MAFQNVMWNRTERPSPLFYTTAYGLVCCLVLGGGTRAGFLSDALLQLLTLPVLLFALWRLTETALTTAIRRVLAFCAVVLLILLAQLVPLPPGVWTHLPGRESIVAAYGVIGRDLPWAPLSMSPSATWLSLLSLLPPLGIFLGALLLDHRERRWLSVLALGFGLVSVFLGLAQLAQGPQSALRFFEFTNPDDSVGFFANRNHYAALLYSLILLAAAWSASLAAPDGQRGARQHLDAASIGALVLSFSVLIVLIVAEAMTRSRGGLILTLIALPGAAALAPGGRRAAWWSSVPVRLMLVAALVALFFLTQYALSGIMGRFDVDALADSRIVFSRNTIAIAKALTPVGAGLGAFVPVYAMFEAPADMPPGVYANHAHNDFLEAWLELGLWAPILIGIALVWFTSRTIRLWRLPQEDGLKIDLALARAAAMIAALLAAHSLVDYPLRTGAMMAIMAFACALLIEPLFKSSVQKRYGPGPRGGGPGRRASLAAENIKIF